MMKKFLFYIFFPVAGILWISNVQGQQSSQTLQLTLEQVVQMAKNQSPDALKAKHSFRGSYWAFKNYRAELMPKLTFDAQLPQYDRDIRSVDQDDGTTEFIEKNSINSSAALRLWKNVGTTGGQIYIDTKLQRTDVLNQNSRTDYLSVPVNIGFRQPLFAFNPFKWAKKIEPLKYQEAKRKYIEEMEYVANLAVTKFFKLLLAQKDVVRSKINKANNDTLYKIAQGRFNIGTIAENELLQMELSMLNARTALEYDNLNMEEMMFDFRSFLRLQNDVNIVLLPPDKILEIEVDADKALAYARNNRSDMVAFERALVEAESNVASARYENRFTVNLFANYGLTKSADTFDQVYIDPKDGQTVSLGLSVPILDWGLARSKIKMAESDQEIVKNSVEQARIDFEREIYLKVMEHNMQSAQVVIGKKTQEVARKRYEVTKQRYMIGKIDITELNIAQNEKDEAISKYYTTLQSYWGNYGDLRKLTLFDFVKQQTISVNLEDLL